MTPPSTVRRFDGYATVETSQISLPEEGFTAHAWVAPAVFGTQDAGSLMVVVAAEPAAGGTRWVLGLDRRGHGVLRLLAADEGRGSALGVLDMVAPAPLPRLAWSHLAVTVDAGGAKVSLAVDGVDVATAALPEQVPVGGQTVLHIGGLPEPDAGRLFRLGRFTGLIAGAAVVPLRDGSAVRQAAPSVDPTQAWATPPDRFAADRDRPRFHFAPPANWMNEPHGIVHRAGRHHLFYQRNELGPFWGSITWGHAVSDDLVHWTDLGSNLTPAGIDYAPDGVWSGSATVDADGTPLLFFTAGDNRDEPNQRTAWARSADPSDPDLRDWVVGPSPVTTLHDALPGLRARGLDPLPHEFRDPFVWHDGDTWFQLVGAGLEGRGGTALLFRAPFPTAATWELVGPLMVGDCAARPDTGVHWELPVLLPVGPDAEGRAKHAFFITPWWPTPTEHSLRFEWYWVGSWDPTTATWTPDHDEPRLIDFGGHFTGVTGSVDSGGRTLLWTITQDLLSDAEHSRRGWAGNAGLPVSIRYSDGDLLVEPVAELAALREAPVLEVDSGVPAWTWDAGPMYEVALVADVPRGARVEVGIRSGDGVAAVTVGVERTAANAGRIWVHRPAGGDPVRDDCGGPFRITPGEAVRLRVFVDQSMVEAYVQEHRSVTTRAFSRAGAGDLGTVSGVGDVLVRHLTVWPLQAAPVKQSLVADRSRIMTATEGGR